MNSTGVCGCVGEGIIEEMWRERARENESSCECVEGYNYNVLCGPSVYECNRCARMNLQVCPRSGICIEDTKECFECGKGQVLCKNDESCAYDHKDCECRDKGIGNMYCSKNGECVENEDDCVSNVDNCESMGMVRCDNQSLAANEYYSNEENMNGYYKERVKEEKERFIEEMEEYIELTGCRCMYSKIFSIERRIVEEEDDFCFCKNETKMISMIRYELLNNENITTCSCVSAQKFDQFVTQFLEDMQDKDDNNSFDDWNSFSLDNDHFPPPELDGNSFEYYEMEEEHNDDEKTCVCHKEEELGNEDINFNDQHQFFDPLHPPEICGANQHQCHKCTSRNLLPCSNGNCVKNLDMCNRIMNINCEDYSLVQCEEEDIQMCAQTLEECNFEEEIDCEKDLKWINCPNVEYTCFPDYSKCPPDPCKSVGLISCPNSDPHFPECQADIRMCGRNCSIAPYYHMCENGECKQFEFECRRGSCKEGYKYCASGECILEDSLCCLEDEFRCMITDTCVKHYESYLCSPDNQCVPPEFPCNHPEYEDVICISDPKFCILPRCFDGEIRCDDGSCRDENDSIEDGCYCEGNVGQIYCPNSYSCINSSNFDDCFDCPSGFDKCENSGKCVELFDDCDEPIECLPGEGLCHEQFRCVSDKNRCYFDKCPFTCQNDGRCVESLQWCCDVGTSLCNVGENKGKCINHTKFWEECSDEDFIICPTNLPHMCHNGSCVEKHIDCTCPEEDPSGNPLYKCDDGDCVTDLSRCVSNRKDVLCPGMFLCDDGSCKMNENECVSLPPCSKGFKRCPNGVDCVQSNQDTNQFCPTIVECPQNRPIFCKSNKACVDNIQKCPQASSCPPDYVLCFDSSCAKTVEDCPIPTMCNPNEVRCVIGGFCAQSFDFCPKGVNCKENEKLCGNICYPESEDCPEQEVCDKYLCPLSFLCVEGPEWCPSIKQCNEGLIKCENQDCVKNPSDCKTGTHCVPPLKKCYGTDKCVNDMSECPTITKCPASKSFLCWDNECVETPDDCREFSECSSSMKRCDSGECILHNRECPTLISCPPDYPIRCVNGICEKSIEFCQDDNCPKEFYRCPSGECVSEKYFCPSTVDCGNQIKCWDSSCKDSLEDCSARVEVVCEDPFPFLCPDNHCYSSSFDCPVGIKCDQENPVFCHGQCVRTESDCKEEYQVICNENEYLCPDGRTCSSNGICHTMISCTDEFPFRCSDSSCRKYPEACPQLQFCDQAYNKICWEGSCISKEQDCPESVVCPPEIPVLCPDFHCVASKQNCSTDFSCRNGTVFCARNKMCLKDEAECDLMEPDQCPLDFIKCLDGRCVHEKNEDKCFNLQGCPQNIPFKCYKDGSCVANQGECDNMEDNVDCDDGMERSLDGLCRDIDEYEDYLPNGCHEDTPFRCMSNFECVISYDECKTNSFCPGEYKRCKGGICVNPMELCPHIPMELRKTCLDNPSGMNFPCFSGMCVFHEFECPLIIPCDEDKPFRCGGICVKNRSNCEGVEQGCPLDFPFRCSNGFCSENEDMCPLPNGCNNNFPTSCDNGKCVVSEEFCNDDDDRLANGCKMSESFRCDNGECVSSLSLCINEFGCNPSKPFRCSNGRCSESINDCGNSTSCDKVVCPTGLCVDLESECLSANGCPAFEPFRCENGECKKFPRDCPPVIRCDDPSFPILCFSGECVVSQTQCKKVSSCPNGQIRCLDQSCRAPNECRDTCPPSSPFKCPNSGICTSSPDYCMNTKEIECKKALKFYCPITETCENSPKDCFDSLDCDDGFYRCFDASCVPDLSLCPVLKKCPNSKPVRCLDGSCLETPEDCLGVEFISCSDVEKRCNDGRCILEAEECPPVAGCPIGQFMCPSLKCVDEIEDCKGEFDQYPCWNGKKYDTFEECPEIPRINPVDVTLSNEEMILSLTDENGDSSIVDIIIPPFSVSSDENETLASSESVTSILVESTSESLIQKALLGNNASESGEKIDICSLVITIKAYNVDGTKRESVQLKQPTKLRFKNKCNEPGANETLELSSINEVTGEFTRESNVSEKTSGNSTFFEGETTHYSSFTLTKTLEVPLSESGFLDDIIDYIYTQLPFYVILLIVLGSICVACCCCCCFFCICYFCYVRFFRRKVKPVIRRENSFSVGQARIPNLSQEQKIAIAQEVISNAQYSSNLNPQ